MKTLLAVLLLAFSTTVAADSYMIKYEIGSHSITVFKGSESDPDKWEKTVYLINADGKVEGTNKTVREFIDSYK